jgi:hypothetical protein
MNKTRSIFRAGLVAAMMMGLTGLVTAQTQEATPAKEAESMGFSPTFVRAYEVAMSRIAKEISHDHQTVLNLAGYAAAAAAICPDLALNESGLYGLLTESSHSDLGEEAHLTPEQHRDFSMIAFGIVTGLMLEEAARDEPAFCERAIGYSNETGQALLRQISSAVQYPPKE